MRGRRNGGRRGEKIERDREFETKTSEFKRMKRVRRRRRGGGGGGGEVC